MADIQVPDSVPCRFSRAWSGKCGKPSTNGWCSEHEGQTCASCGQQAVKSCEYTNGSYGCSAPLCASCGHSLDGHEHVTREVLNAQYQRRREEDDVLKVSRTSSSRRLDPESGLPVNLFELLKTNPEQDGFRLGKIFFLELDHGLMACVPAIFSEDENRVVVTADLHVLERVWETLEPRKASICSRTAYVNVASGWAYLDAQSQHEREQSVPMRLLRSVDEFSELMHSQTQPFRWAPGLFGDRGMDMRSYIRQMQECARTIDPSFSSTNAVL